MDIADAANFALSQLGFPTVEPSLVWRHIGGGIRVLLGNLLQTQNMGTLTQAVEYFRHYYREHCLDKTVCYPGIKEVLEDFSGRGKRLAVVTNKNKEFTDKILEGLGLTRYFSSVVGANSGDKKKPDPELIHRALSQMNAADRQAVIVGDSPADIEAGRKAGTKTCGVGYGIGESEIIRAALPDYWAQIPLELLRLF